MLQADKGKIMLRLEQIFENTKDSVLSYASIRYKRSRELGSAPVDHFRSSISLATVEEMAKRRISCNPNNKDRLLDVEILSALKNYCVECYNRIKKKITSNPDDMEPTELLWLVNVITNELEDILNWFAGEYSVIDMCTFQRLFRLGWTN